MSITPGTRSRRDILIPDDMPEVLDALGVEVDRIDGREIVALCPMHEARTGKADSKPSWSINVETGVHHCFSCGYAGHVVGLVADLRDTDFNQARRWLRRAGVNLDLAEQLPGYWDRPAIVKKRPIPEAVLQGFVEPPEKAMEKRKVTPESVAHYGVMWDPKERGWILPIRYPSGDLLGWQFKRKSTVLNEPPKMKKAVTLFGIDCFVGKRAILVESPLDCLYLYSIGIPGAVSCFGSNVSDDQMRLVLEYADELIIALDDDSAGRRETKRLLTGVAWKRDRPERCINWTRRIATYVFNYDGAEGKDPGEMTKPEVYKGIRDARHVLECL